MQIRMFPALSCLESAGFRMASSSIPRRVMNLIPGTKGNWLSSEIRFGMQNASAIDILLSHNIRPSIEKLNNFAPTHSRLFKEVSERSVYKDS